MALSWYGLFEQTGMHKLTLSVAAIMGIFQLSVSPKTKIINTAEEIMTFIMIVIILIISFCGGSKFSNNIYFQCCCFLFFLVQVLLKVCTFQNNVNHVVFLFLFTEVLIRFNSG